MEISSDLGVWKTWVAKVVAFECWKYGVVAEAIVFGVILGGDGDFPATQL